MKLTKVAFAIASVLAVAAGSANAGQIDSSSATLATEVIVNDAQVVRAPSKTYSFAGDIDARTNEQRLQLQYTLNKGTWAVGAGTEFAAVNALTAFPVDKLLTMTATSGSCIAPATLIPDDSPRHSPSLSSRSRTTARPSASEMRNCVSIGAPSRLAVMRF